MASSKMCEKRKNGAECIKNISRNKIQRSDERVSQDKESLERHKIVFKTKCPQVRCIAHGSFGLSQCKSSSKKNMLVDKIFRKYIISVTEVKRISVQPLYFINHTPTVLYNQKYKEYEIMKNVEISTK